MELSLEERKRDVLKLLDEVENEATILLERIKKARKAVIDVQDEDDVAVVVEDNDLEEGFEHIELS